jgi:hypothetical protein
MSDRMITVTHNGVDYSGQLAVIKSTMLGLEDHGILSAMLHLAWAGGGIGFGGYGMDTPVFENPSADVEHRGAFLRREGSGWGADHLMRILDTVGVERWEALPGKQVIVLFAGKSAWGSTAAGIAHVIEDRVYLPKEHTADWAAQHPTEVDA